MLLVDPVVCVISCRCGGKAFWLASCFCIGCHHLSSPPGKEDQPSKAVLPWNTSYPLAPGLQPVLLRKGILTGFTRRKEEKAQTCGFEEVILGLRQALLTLLFFPVMREGASESNTGHLHPAPRGSIRKMNLWWQSRQGPDGGWRLAPV